MDIKPTILIAEDDLAMSHLMAFRFRAAGYSVTTTTNGLDAWNYAQAVQFDVVMTDHQMPSMTGLELCERLREMPTYAHTPIILITGKAFELELPRLTKSLNLTAIFGKPFSPAAVLRTVDESLTLPV